MPRGQDRGFLAIIGQQAGQPGRRTIYDAGVHCQMVRDLAQEGKFPETWCAKIGVTMKCLREWVRDHAEFSEAVIIARHLLAAYWSEYVQKNLTRTDLKQGVLVELLRKRLPEIWGSAPRDVWDHIHSEDAVQGIPLAPRAPAGAQSPTVDGQSLRGMSAEDLQMKRAAQRARRAAENG